jgi:hypothetical protein
MKGQVKGMGFSLKGTTLFYKQWFHGTPVNAVKASATLTFSGVVSDGEEVVIGSNAYEFDNDTNLENGSATAISMTPYLNEARGTITFTGVVLAAQIVTIGTEVYEFVAAAEDVADPENIPLVMGADMSADNAVTVLGLAISSVSAIADAVSNTTTDTVLVIADAKGTAGNTIASTTTCLNASFAEVTLTGGLDTITASSAVTALVASITANDDYVTAVDGALDTVVVSYYLVGTEGNAIIVSTDAANATWGVDVTALSGGIYATPCNASSAVIVIGNDIYFTDKPCDKWTQDAWYLASPTLV